MATIEKRGKRWRARVRRKGFSASETFRTRREAERWAAEMEARADAGNGVVRWPFSYALRRYRDEVSKYKDGYRWERLRIDAFLGEPTRSSTDREPDPLALVPMCDLAPEHFADWRDRRLREVSVATVLREWNLLSAICSRAAKEWGWLPKNPMSNVRRPKAPEPRSRRISEEEIERVLLVADWAPGQEPIRVSQRVAAAFLFAIETAMRAGEICALRWGDIDELARVSTVRAEEVGARKTGRSRKVPLSKKAMEIVASFQRQADNNRVFGITSRQLDANWRKIRKAAAIEDLHFHDTRAEALTRLSRKLDVMKLARMSGHRDLKVLLNTYYREDPADFVDLLD